MHSTCGPNGGNTNTEFDALLLARAAATITITKISHSYHFLSASCSITDKYFCQLLAESHSAVSLSVVLKCRHFFPYSDCMCLFPDYLSWPLSCPLYLVCFDYNLVVSTAQCERKNIFGCPAGTQCERESSLGHIAPGEPVLEGALVGHLSRRNQCERESRLGRLAWGIQCDREST